MQQHQKRGNHRHPSQRQGPPLRCSKQRASALRLWATYAQGRFLSMPVSELSCSTALVLWSLIPYLKVSALFWFVNGHQSTHALCWNAERKLQQTAHRRLGSRGMLRQHTVSQRHPRSPTQEPPMKNNATNIKVVELYTTSFLFVYLAFYFDIKYY